MLTVLAKRPRPLSIWQEYSCSQHQRPFFITELTTDSLAPRMVSKYIPLRSASSTPPPLYRQHTIDIPSLQCKNNMACGQLQCIRNAELVRLAIERDKDNNHNKFCHIILAIIASVAVAFTIFRDENPCIDPYATISKSVFTGYLSMLFTKAIGLGLTGTLARYTDLAVFIFSAICTCVAIRQCRFST